MSKRRGLGKGLEALIPPMEALRGANPAETEEYREIETDKIMPATDQARKQFDPGKLDELKASIREHGVLQPILVRPLEGGGYQLIAGERRWRACRELEIKTIPAMVKNYQNPQATAISLIENIQREDLSPLEEAAAYQKLIREHRLTQEDVSLRVGKSRSFVANMVRLLELSGEVRGMLEAGRISAGHARALLSVRDPAKQLRLAVKAEQQQMSVRQIEKQVRMVTDETTKRSDRDRNSKDSNRDKKYLRDIEATIREYFEGIPVRLKASSKGGGKLEITYSDLEDLRRIIKTILGQETVSRETINKLAD